MATNERPEIDKVAEKTVNKHAKTPCKKYVRYPQDIEINAFFIAAYTFFWILIFTAMVLVVEWLGTGVVSLQNTMFVYLIASGGLGGAINSAISFSTHYKNGSYNPNYIWRYAYRPIVGAILGLFVFYFIVGGLLTITAGSNSSSVSSDISNYSFRTQLFFCAISFLVGYTSTNFLKKLEATSKVLFSDSEDETPAREIVESAIQGKVVPAEVEAGGKDGKHAGIDTDR